MRRWLLLGSLAAAWTCGAQQEYVGTQYATNPYWLSPAAVGAVPSPQLVAAARTSWIGLPGAPTTGSVAFATPIAPHNDPATSSHGALGGSLVADRVGPVSTMDFGASYAYHLRLRGRRFLAVGLTSALRQIRFDRDDVVLLDDPLDPNVVSFSRVGFDADVGAAYYGETAFLVAGYRNVVGALRSATAPAEAPEGSTVSTIRTRGQASVMGGLRLRRGSQTYVPALVAHHAAGGPILLDVALKAYLREGFYLGGAYRHGVAGIGLIGGQVTRRLELGYSVDVGLGQLSRGTGQGHELVAVYSFRGRSRVYCPSLTF